jgi:sterol desaturase/sphingolipid hydroxylase (fatty acid hydroxylase superfamily)
LISLNKLILIGLTSNIAFYTIHRILHQPIFYKLIHHVHHEYIEPVGPSALYAHPIEFIFSNNLAFLIPFCIFGTRYYIALGMIFFGSFMTVSAHVNHKIKFFGDNHLYHHKKFNYNFGFGSYLDKLLNTNYQGK